MSQTSFAQTVDVSGYKPNGLTALVIWYTRNFDADSDDTSTAKITALDADDVEIGSVTTSEAIVGPTTTWRRAELTKVLPDGTAKVKVTIDLAGNDPPDAAIAGVSLHIGQMSDELISNGSFTNGTFTDWDNVTNSFAANTTTEYATDGTTKRCAQSGSFASCEIKQDVAIPEGYEHGDAVLTIARMDTGTDTGEVVLEVLDDGDDQVLASATTGAEIVSGGWERRRLIVTLPDGAETLRVRLVAERPALGINGALFDDVSLRIHKDLDPAFECVFDFTAPQYQPMPRTWHQAYLSWPSIEPPMAWNGSDLLPSVRASQQNSSATAAWSDGSTPTPANFVGYWEIDGDSALVANAYRFARADAGDAVDLQVDGYGEFASTDTFSVAVCFRVTERAMSAACGLVGRRDPTGKGWGLQLDAAGRVVAAVEGATERVATGTIDHRDAAPHWVLMTWNGTTLRVVDAAGSVTNGSSPGEFSINAYPMRIGRDGEASATGGIDIARVLVWDGTAISESEFLDTIHQIGTDPNGRIDRDDGWTSSKPVWVDAGDDADGNARLVRSATRHVPIGYDGESYGVSIGQAHTNLVQSTDYEVGAHCGPEANVTVTHGIEDPTGLARGVRVLNSVAGYGYRLSDMPIGSNAGTVHVVLWLASQAVSQDIVVRLLDSDEVVISNDTVTVTQQWQRFAIELSWSGTTPTGHLKISIDGSAGAWFHLAGVVWAGLDAQATAYPDAAVSVGDRHGAVVETLPLQLNYEGEIEVRGLVTTHVHGSYIASLDNGTTDQKNQRAIAINNDEALAMLWDDSGTPSSIGSEPTWTSAVKLRARWNSLELPEALGSQVGIGIDDETAASDSVDFSLSATVPSEQIRIGGGNPNGSTSSDAWLRRVVVRAREEKLE